jgi:hypothetical protein
MTDRKPSDHDAEDFGVVNLQTPGEIDYMARQRYRGEGQRDGERNATRRAYLGAYSLGEEVDTPHGTGVIVDEFIKTREFAGETIQASDDNVSYAVAVEDTPGDRGYGIYQEEDLEDGELDVTGPADPDDVVEAEMSGLTMNPEEMNPDEARLSVTDFRYPESWRESDTPNRVILMKAWAGMNAQFDCGGDCCMGEMRGEVVNPAAFCASMKDRILLTEDWRS